MNKTLILQDLSEEYNDALKSLHKLKLLINCVEYYFDLPEEYASKELKEKALAAQKRYKERYKEKEGDLLALGAACDSLKADLTNMAEKPEQGAH